MSVRGMRDRSMQSGTELARVYFLFVFKGLGHAILGNFSTDQMVIELTKI